MYGRYHIGSRRGGNMTSFPFCSNLKKLINPNPHKITTSISSHVKIQSQSVSQSHPCFIVWTVHIGTGQTVISQGQELPRPSRIPRTWRRGNSFTASDEATGGDADTQEQQLLWWWKSGIKDRSCPVSDSSRELFSSKLSHAVCVLETRGQRWINRCHIELSSSNVQTEAENISTSDEFTNDGHSLVQSVWIVSLSVWPPSQIQPTVVCSGDYPHFFAASGSY